MAGEACSEERETWSWSLRVSDADLSLRLNFAFEVLGLFQHRRRPGSV